MKKQNFSLQEITRIAFFAALTAVLAFLVIPLPFSPVPITGQTLGVMLAGLLLNGKHALLSQFIYLLLGLGGLPIFAGGNSGPGALLGPTGGFIWAFLPAAYFIGRFTGGLDSGKSVFYIFFILFSGGGLLIYVPGIVQLMLVMDLSVIETVTVALIPFLPGDLLKMLLAFLVARKLDFKVN